jgi:hypothetical protein
MKWVCFVVFVFFQDAERLDEVYPTVRLTISDEMKVNLLCFRIVSACIESLMISACPGE